MLLGRSLGDGRVRSAQVAGGRVQRDGHPRRSLLRVYRRRTTEIHLCMGPFPVLQGGGTHWMKSFWNCRNLVLPLMWGDAGQERIATLVPGKVGDPGRSWADNRLFVEAVPWIVRVGAPWHDLPS